MFEGTATCRLSKLVAEFRTLGIPLTILTWSKLAKSWVFLGFSNLLELFIWKALCLLWQFYYNEDREIRQYIWEKTEHEAYIVKRHMLLICHWIVTTLKECCHRVFVIWPYTAYMDNFPSAGTRGSAKRFILSFSQS